CVRGHHFVLRILRSPRSTLFPYTTLFRSDRHSSFDLGAVQIGFVGNLYKDYEQGKNLDFNLRFGTSPQTGTNNSYLNLLDAQLRSEEHTSELQSRENLVCRLLLEKKKDI